MSHLFSEILLAEIYVRNWGMKATPPSIPPPSDNEPPKSEKPDVGTIFGISSTFNNNNSNNNDRNQKTNQKGIKGGITPTIPPTTPFLSNQEENFLHGRFHD